MSITGIDVMKYLEAKLRLLNGDSIAVHFHPGCGDYELTVEICKTFVAVAPVGAGDVWSTPVKFDGASGYPAYTDDDHEIDPFASCFAQIERDVGLLGENPKLKLEGAP